MKKTTKILILIAVIAIILTSCFRFPQLKTKAIYIAPEVYPYEDTNGEYMVFMGFEEGSNYTETIWASYKNNEHSNLFGIDVFDLRIGENLTWLTDTNIFAYLSVGDVVDPLHYSGGTYLINKRYNKTLIDGHNYLVLNSDLFAYYLLDLEYNRIVYFSFEDDTIPYHISTINNNLAGSNYQYKVGNKYRYNAESKELYLVDAYDFRNTASYDVGYFKGYNEGYQIGYDAGYQVGYDLALSIGYNEGFLDGKIEGEYLGYEGGYDAGYTFGFQEGYNAGLQNIDNLNHNWIVAIFGSISTILSIKLVGNISIGMIIGVPLILMLVLFVLQLIRGK